MISIRSASGLSPALLIGVLWTVGCSEPILPDFPESPDAGFDAEPPDAFPDFDMEPVDFPDQDGGEVGDTGEVSEVSLDGDDDPDWFEEPDLDAFRIPSFPVITIEARVNFATLEESERVLPRALNGSGNISYSVDRLPEGVTFAPAQRALAGAIEAPGLYAAVYIAVDSTDQEARRPFVIRVTDDSTAPLLPASFTFIDTEDEASLVRAADFSWEWEPSRSTDVAEQRLLLSLDGVEPDHRRPIAVFTENTTSSFVMERAADSNEQCLRAETDYVLTYEVEDIQGNEATAEFRFTSDEADGTNRLTNATFDVHADDWDEEVDGPSARMRVIVIDEDAGGCSGSQAVRISNQSDSELIQTTRVELHQCVGVDASRTYGMSADIFVDVEQGREGRVRTEATWFRTSDCSGTPAGIEQLENFPPTGDWRFDDAGLLFPPTAARSALVRLVVEKTPVGDEQLAETSYIAWFDNVFFGPVD